MPHLTGPHPLCSIAGRRSATSIFRPDIPLGACSAPSLRSTTAPVPCLPRVIRCIALSGTGKRRRHHPSLSQRGRGSATFLQGRRSSASHLLPWLGLKARLCPSSSWAPRQGPRCGRLLVRSMCGSAKPICCLRQRQSAEAAPTCRAGAGLLLPWSHRAFSRLPVAATGRTLRPSYMCSMLRLSPLCTFGLWL